jgi:benzil reductase ((S)-benzoin forming)
MMVLDETTSVVVTGASRGMGEAIALQAARAGAQVLGISRSVSEALAATGAQQWRTDLANPLAIAPRLHDWWVEQTHRSGVAQLVLINNAALVTPPSNLAQTDWAALSAACRVSLEAVVVLSAAFLQATATAGAQRRLCNISSGLGRRAMAGAANYCAVKAGMDHLSRAIALEEAAIPNGARVASLAPGIIDTDMQLQLRSAPPDAFAAQPTFAQYHASGALTSPADAAARVWAYIARDDFGTQPVADVRD